MKTIVNFILCLMIAIPGISQTFKPTWESLGEYNIPEWYQDAKLGIFIHWGVYAVPATLTEWYPRRMYDKNNEDNRNESDYEYHVKEWGGPEKKGYKDFIPMFTAKNYNPIEWVDLFENSGAKFVMPVGEHHDGFAMYNSTITDWNVVKMGPQRDVYQELIREVRKRNLKVGISSHYAHNCRYFEYNHKHGYDARDTATWGLYNTPDAYPHAQHIQNWYNRTKEMIDLFKPDILYFDWMIKEDQYTEGKKKIASYYYNKGIEWGRGDPGVVLTYKSKSYPEYTAVMDMEHAFLPAIRETTWQTHTSVGRLSWGYRNNDKYRKPQRIVDYFIDIVSKNGVLLLNVGPNKDGTIIDEQKEILLELGAWLKINGEAIYSTRVWNIYGEGSTTAKSVDDYVDFKSTDIRFTQSKDGSAIYAIFLDWPKGKETAEIFSMKKDLLEASEINSIQFLGSDQQLEWDQDTVSLKVVLPDAKPLYNYAYPLKITFK